MPGTSGPDNSWSSTAPKSGPGSWSGSQRGVGDGFDIGTWENPGGAGSGGGGSGSGGSGGGWDRQGGGNKGGWDDGGSKQWSRNDGMGSSNDSQWSDGGGGDKWSTNDGASNQWSTNDDSIGTWENPSQQTTQQTRPNLKPLRNEESRQWGTSEPGSGGGWGDSGQTTPPRTDWANSSAGSEISPGSAWKKEPSVVGNWADEIQSPRDKEENPLDVSLKEARRSLSNW